MNPIIELWLEKKAELTTDKLDKVFNHHTMSALLGGGIGAGIGALSSKKHRGQGALIGGSLGAAGGYGLSDKFPETSENINQAIIKHLVRKPIGRIATNLIPPVGYQPINDLRDEYKEHGLSGMAKSVYNDKPLYDTEHNIGHIRREVPYRRNFDLKPRFGKDVYQDNPDGSIGFNYKSKDGLNSLVEILDPGMKQHPVMSNYSRTFRPDGGVHYKDVWDWDLHPNDPKDSLHNTSIKSTIQNLARYLVNRSAKPTTIEGDMSPSFARILRNATGLQQP